MSKHFCIKGMERGFSLSSITVADTKNAARAVPPETGPPRDYAREGMMQLCADSYEAPS